MYTIVQATICEETHATTHKKRRRMPLKRLRTLGGGALHAPTAKRPLVLVEDSKYLDFALLRDEFGSELLVVKRDT